ncbi:hypothetical protein ABW19_dt0208117 [Dactylella cylindrospora]|nr:hypothetical protein ABW19_dt0208117 [Dactylella cylindrospora]
MASPQGKKPVMKPMFFKRKILPPKSQQKPKTDLLESASSNTASIVIDDSPSSSKTPTSSQSASTAQKATSGRNATKKKEKRETGQLDDLEYWGRSKDVHAGMLRIEEERIREREAEHRRKVEEASALAKKKRQEQQDKRYSSRASKRRKSDEGAIAISDEDSDDTDDTAHRPRRPSAARTRSPSLLPELNAEADEVNKILEDYKRKQAQAKAAPPTTQVSQRAISENPPAGTQTNGRASTEPADKTKDIIVQILVVSRIEGVKPMVFNRKFGQTLGVVRTTWGKMQHFDESRVDRLVLIWRNETRVFDSTVPKSLGIRFDREGKMYIEDKNRRTSLARRQMEEEQAIHDGIKPDECKIVFDAMWEEDWEQLVKEREEAKNAWELSGDDEEEVPGIALNVKPMFIMLKGKNFKQLKMKVKPTMKVSEVIQVIREERNLDENDTEIELHFDGDELEEDMTLEDAEIEHEFQIDVILK